MYFIAQKLQDCHLRFSTIKAEIADAISSFKWREICLFMKRGHMKKQLFD